MLKRPSDEVVNAMHWCYLVASVTVYAGLVMVAALHVEVVGELALQLRMPSDQAPPRASVHGPKTSLHGPKTSLHDPKTSLYGPKTSLHGQRAARDPPRECVYQLPQRVHLDAMLSHMMNELTKVPRCVPTWLKQLSLPRVVSMGRLGRFDNHQTGAGRWWYSRSCWCDVNRRRGFARRATWSARGLPWTSSMACTPT